LPNPKLCAAEAILAEPGQARAFFKAREQLIEWKIPGFHRFHDGFEFTEGFLESGFGRFRGLRHEA